MGALTRDQAIAKIRAQLLKHVDDEHSSCDVAARLHIFCGGFARWTFTELKQRYPMIVRSRPRITPQELRRLANRWQLARQMVKHQDLACDVQTAEGALRTCKGWDEFSDEDLARFVSELCGEEASVGQAPPDEPSSRSP